MSLKRLQFSTSLLPRDAGGSLPGKLGEAAVGATIAVTGGHALISVPGCGVPLGLLRS